MVYDLCDVWFCIFRPRVQLSGCASDQSDGCGHSNAVRQDNGRDCITPTWKRHQNSQKGSTYTMKQTSALVRLPGCANMEWIWWDRTACINKMLKKLIHDNLCNFLIYWRLVVVLFGDDGFRLKRSLLVKATLRFTYSLFCTTTREI